jgi:heme oxygenase
MNQDPPRVEPKSLPIKIQAATRSCHAVLNRSITSRLPLCLPPNAATPGVYAGGIACFGRIYFLFEHVWEDLLTCRSENPRIHDALKQLKLPSLCRSARLRADLSLFDQRLGGQAESYKMEGDELAALLDRTREAILKKPFLIMSYTWVMYLALFNGGRWIRAQLEQAGPEFWDTQVHTLTSKMDCLSFWEFEDELDGEEIKYDFKARFNTAAAVLDDAERQDVVDECVRVFETCSQMVGWLDKQTQPISAQPIVPEA